jgi:hypothetical protein
MNECKENGRCLQPASYMGRHQTKMCFIINFPITVKYLVPCCICLSAHKSVSTANKVDRSWTCSQISNGLENTIEDF